MKKLFSFFLIAALPLCAWDTYAELLKLYPELYEPNGNPKLGEIEIVLDPAKVEEIQQKQYERLRELGIPADRANKWTKTGEIARDKYFIWVRDAVIFPSGAGGLYDRIISESALGGNIGAAVLPVFPNGDIGVVVQYRHATRSWELELPRGSSEGKESSLETAKRELKEEAGLEAAQWTQLGLMAPDTGILQSKVPIFLAKDLKEVKSSHDESEAIDGLIRLPLKKLNNALKEGSIELEIKGVKQRVYVRDSFLTYALYLAALQ
jgi:ADP-ribose pyrophosphatase